MAVAQVAAVTVLPQARTSSSSSSSLYSSLSSSSVSALVATAFSTSSSSDSLCEEGWHGCEVGGRRDAFATAAA